MVLQHCECAVAAKSLQSCPTLCDPIDGSPPGSPVPGILQARTLEWVAIVFSNTWKWKVKVKSLSPIWLLATPWTAAHQAPPSMGFSRQEYWSGLPLLLQYLQQIRQSHRKLTSLRKILCPWKLHTISNKGTKSSSLNPSVAMEIDNPNDATISYL